MGAATVTRNAIWDDLAAAFSQARSDPVAAMGLATKAIRSYDARGGDLDEFDLWTLAWGSESLLPDDFLDDVHEFVWRECLGEHITPNPPTRMIVMFMRRPPPGLSLKKILAFADSYAELWHDDEAREAWVIQLEAARLTRDAGDVEGARVRYTRVLEASSLAIPERVRATIEVAALEDLAGAAERLDSLIENLRTEDDPSAHDALDRIERFRKWAGDGASGLPDSAGA